MTRLVPLLGLPAALAAAMTVLVLGEAWLDGHLDRTRPEVARERAALDLPVREGPEDASLALEVWVDEDRMLVDLSSMLEEDAPLPWQFRDVQRSWQPSWVPVVTQSTPQRSPSAPRARLNPAKDWLQLAHDLWSSSHRSPQSTALPLRILATRATPLSALHQVWSTASVHGYRDISMAVRRPGRGWTDIPMERGCGLQEKMVLDETTVYVLQKRGSTSEGRLLPCADGPRCLAGEDSVLPEANQTPLCVQLTRWDQTVAQTVEVLQATRDRGYDPMMSFY